MQCNSCSKCHILCFYCLKVNGSNRADGENNEFEQWSRIRAPQPRNGWSTPTYDDILSQKRKEEKSYRLVICYRMLFISTIQGSSFVYAYRITAHLLNIHLIQNVVQKLFWIIQLGMERSYIEYSTSTCSVICLVECIELLTVGFRRSVWLCVTVADVLMILSRLMWMRGIMMRNCFVSIPAASHSCVVCSLAHDSKCSSQLMTFL